MKTLIVAQNVKKGETPTTRNGAPDNYFLVGFLSEEHYKKSLDHAWSNNRNLIKTQVFLWDHVLLSDSRIISTADYLDEIHGVGNNLKLAKPVKRIIKKGMYDFDLERAKKEVIWFGNL